MLSKYGEQVQKLYDTKTRSEHFFKKAVAMSGRR